MFLSLLFLFWAFYELSDGADYAPAPNSLQAQARRQAEGKTPRPAAPGTRATRAVTPGTLKEVEAAMNQIDRRAAAARRVSVSLTTTRTSTVKVVEAEASRPKADPPGLDPSGRGIGRDGAGNGAIEAAIAAALGEMPTDPAHPRWVKEGIVDLRAGPGLAFERIAQLARGTEVAVLEDPGNGWLEVQVSGRFETGWLAGWLLAEPRWPPARATTGRQVGRSRHRNPNRNRDRKNGVRAGKERDRSRKEA